MQDSETGIDAARLFVPDWNFSPFAGVNYSSWSVEGVVSILGTTFDTGGGMPGVFYLTFGLDWQADFGLNVGAGGNLLLSPKELTDSVTIVP